MNERETMQELLLSYVGLLAERHGYGPGEGFEYKLFDDLLSPHPTLVSEEEKGELTFLAESLQQWVSFDVETGMLQLVDFNEWEELLKRREH
jgi:hypothetical protein